MHVQGPQSFEDLRTVNGKLCATFEEACVERQLLRNGSEYERCMDEAVLRVTPASIRRLFATIYSVATQDQLPHIAPLWKKFVAAMTEDFVRQGATAEVAKCRCYAAVNAMLARTGSFPVCYRYYRWLSWRRISRTTTTTTTLRRRRRQ